MNCINRNCQRPISEGYKQCKYCGTPVVKVDSFKLRDTLNGRSITTNVIPTVCNIKNMINKLRSVNGNIKELKQWEKRSYSNYKLEKIHLDILNCEGEEIIPIVRKHILNLKPTEYGAAILDIYFVAYFMQNIGENKQDFFRYCLQNNIVGKENSAGAIWQVGKNDGYYLDILNKDGAVKDWGFMYEWVNNK